MSAHEALAGALRPRRPPFTRTLSRQDAGRLSDSVGERTWLCHRVAVQGINGLVRPTRQGEHRVCGSAVEPRSPEGRPGRGAAAELPSVLRRRVRSLEDWRRRRLRESHLHRTGARAGARSDASGDRHRADAVLRAAQAGTGSHRREAGHRDIDQGIPARNAASAVHAVQGSQGRPSDHARRRRFLATEPARDASRRPETRRHSRARRSRGDSVERRHDRHAKRRRRAPSSLRCRRPAAVRVDEVGQAAVGRRDHAAVAALSRLRQRRRTAARVRRTEPARRSFRIPATSATC